MNPRRAGRDPNVMYYMTVYNEPYRQPAEPDGVDVDGLLRGLYRYAQAPGGPGPRAQILASGVAMPWAQKAQEMLASEWGVQADLWSATSYGELRRDGVECEQHNQAHPDDDPHTPYVTTALAEAAGPVVAVSDWMRAVPDLIRPWVPGDYTTLGTDGFGLSDTRPATRRHFGVDAENVVGRGPRGARAARRGRPVDRARRGPALPDRRPAGRRPAGLGQRRGLTARNVRTRTRQPTPS